jgi:hypothetical protein
MVERAQRTDAAGRDEDMNERDDELKAALRRAVAPMDHSELERDLWPQMERRLASGSVHVAWLDWGLAAAAILWLLLFPEILLPLLYHL